MWLSILAIFCGAGLGALLRTGFNLLSVGVASVIPLGTLISNMVGGYLIGIALAFFGNNPHLSPEWKLLIITGFLGGLTTFSSFSAEVVTMIQRGEFTWALGTALLHLVGSLVLTLLGIWTYQAIK
ncbi:fluoride efflux transporter CrcB [Polynucleobacter asymbioticus]|jgi:CrcB protein|uniref:Fluoride-specific ion channel FluC n=2 Tax=Polynucleobacter asymbioticus TaxID=576611 RepID=FLUC_POLAQ|nr:fluoride efflux transporter CrcB [Polynucleobacter asymbioticus]A4SW33.1 RecName: Full=Fluoride-specific ion channel FluC [Polynucleobacter asymbioticus QLW-P1DMWA-1]ABP33697.1 camphor resistance protein CrcB [Polynucleobacter asymbioticus QLW-P1DMWA-1]APB98364.1 fluoride ion transporter CrcB [Polynucleobacter asymbioticus]APC00650.1 fluoride ion transporter CrcB [Polynucleobacter asymbioticus]APC05496.1 fluoride ion transporter CrcB [Polynucleobacter asymbioticus]